MVILLLVRLLNGVVHSVVWLLLHGGGGRNDALVCVWRHNVGCDRRLRARRYRLMVVDLLADRKKVLLWWI